MKIKITATTIVDSDDYSEEESTLIEDFNSNNGEIAFEQLQEVAQCGDVEFKCVAEEVKE